MIAKLGRLAIAVLVLSGLLVGLSRPMGAGFEPGPLLEPYHGLYRTAVIADAFGSDSVELAPLSGPVRILRDERGVPHIFAQSDRDAIVALGYVTAQDRLFQIDFVSRAASGRLAEVLGEGALSTDQYFRRIGLRWAGQKNADWIRQEASEQADLISWYQAGANAWIAGLRPEDDPFEFRLLGYRPTPLELEDALAVLLYMSYDLSYSDKDLDYTRLKSTLVPEDYERLYPRYSHLAVPIAGTPSRTEGAGFNRDDVQSREISDGVEAGSIRSSTGYQASQGAATESMAVASVHGSAASARGDAPDHRDNPLTEGLLPGKGSNNWAVDGWHSTTQHPILAGDMHLTLSVPAVWYEAHLVTPTMNVYGVTTPGAPAIIEGITPETAWAFTNTGSDQIDFFRLQLTEDGAGYYVDGEAEPFELVIDTIAVAGGTAVIDTLLISRFGPVSFEAGEAMAVRWAAHDTSRTMLAIWKMGHATDYDSFQDATRFWDSPMQNILFAGADGTVAIRSTGYLPVRADNDGSVVLDGSSSGNAWKGRVPFDELPALIRPQRGFVTSTNQPPADSTYPFYFGNDWREAYRSIRIDQLLRSREAHSVADIKSYQADVHAVQADLFLPFIESLSDLSDGAETVRNRLLAWNGETTVDQSTPILFDSFLKHLETLVWDEPQIRSIRLPSETTLLSLLTESPESVWFDREGTAKVETSREILSAALESVATEQIREEQTGAGAQTWGDVHKLLIRHLTRSPGLSSLGRGPFDFPGYRETLSPGGQMVSTHSASWRVVVDFSHSPPEAFGVYPGGQSGNPFSVRYDSQIATYLAFEYYPLLLPSVPSAIPPDAILHELILLPTSDP